MMYIFIFYGLERHMRTTPMKGGPSCFDRGNYALDAIIMFLFVFFSSSWWLCGSGAYG